MNLTELLNNSAKRFSDKTALLDGNESVTYAELWEDICSVSQTLESSGVSSGSMIGLQLENSILFVVLSYALWKCEATVVPIPASMQKAETNEIAKRMSLSAIISNDQTMDAATSHIVVNKSENTKRTVSVHLQTSSKNQSQTKYLSDVNAAFVRFTSGTTSQNKGVVLSHKAIFDRISAANEVLQVDQDDTIMWCLPMAHHFVVTIIRYLWCGASIVLLKSIEAEYVLNEIEKHKGTILYASPFHYDLLSRNTSDKSIDSVRYAISTTTGISKEITESFYTRYGIHLMQAYGIIELGLACVNTDDPAGKPLSVGRPMKGFEIRLANTDEYSEKDNPLGEVEVRGPGFFDAYYDPWIPAKELMNDGWFHTGDLGSIDNSGFLFLHGRVNSVINTAGMKVFPEEIESILNLCPGVDESHVFGAKHAHLGEVPEAEVVLTNNAGNLSENDIRTHCSKSLFLYKVPNRISFVEEICRTEITGKIKRHS